MLRIFQEIVNLDLPLNKEISGEVKFDFQQRYMQDEAQTAPDQINGNNPIHLY